MGWVYDILSVLGQQHPHTTKPECNYRAQPRPRPTFKLKINRVPSCYPIQVQSRQSCREACLTLLYVLPASHPNKTNNQAERERQRENEIRAFRDFSINLSSSTSPSASVGRGSGGIGVGFHEDDADFPRGAHKRAEYKTGGISLDALREPTVRVRTGCHRRATAVCGNSCSERCRLG